MQWEIEIIRALQKLSCGFFDALNIALTQLGDEIFFMAVAVLLYWCFDKKFAYKFMNVYLFSVAVNEGVKTLVGRRRPYTVEGVRSIGNPTSGASFPSGHSQSIACISAQINMKYREGVLKKIFLPVGIALTALVMFTRIYLGQHYLTDTIVGCALGIALAFVFSFLFDLLGDKEEWLIFAAPLCLAAAVILGALGVENVGNVMTVLGAYTAITVGYFLEKKFVRYKHGKSKWWKQIIKVAVGLVTVLALKEGLKFAFEPEQYLLYNYLRYFIVGLWASVGCMTLFKLCRL